MAEEKKLRQTYGTFDVVGTITVVPDTFQIDLKGKNNPNYNYSRINMKFEDDKGGSFWLNAMDGFDTVKGKTIYANIKDSETNEQMQINFADRHNEDILKHIDNRSFVSVALRKVQNEEGKTVWEYKNFLALYDAINYIKDRFQTGMKLRVTGKTRYSIYNGEIQKDFQINNIYLLQDDDKHELGFSFKQDVILKDDSLDLDEWNEKLVAKINGEVLQKSKGKYQLLKLPLIIRGNEENKSKVEMMIDKFLKVEEGKVRRIKLEGKYNTGYTTTKVTEADLPDEAKELIEMGLYDLEEILKMYALGDRVDEMLVSRPNVIKPRQQGETPRIDFSDAEYTLDDLTNLEVELPKEEETTINITDDDLSFLDDLA